jgi:hypothetical protein
MLSQASVRTCASPPCSHKCLSIFALSGVVARVIHDSGTFSVPAASHFCGSGTVFSASQQAQRNSHGQGQDHRMWNENRETTKFYVVSGFVHRVRKAKYYFTHDL